MGGIGSAGPDFDRRGSDEMSIILVPRIRRDMYVISIEFLSSGLRLTKTLEYS